MSQTPGCKCGHNLLDHADCWDEGVKEGVCMKKGCSCGLFAWDGLDGDEILLSPYVALSNWVALRQKQ